MGGAKVHRIGTLPGTESACGSRLGGGASANGRDRKSIEAHGKRKIDIGSGALAGGAVGRDAGAYVKGFEPH